MEQTGGTALSFREGRAALAAALAPRLARCRRGRAPRTPSTGRCSTVPSPSCWAAWWWAARATCRRRSTTQGRWPWHRDPSLLASVESFEATWIDPTASGSRRATSRDSTVRPVALALRLRGPAGLDGQPHPGLLRPDPAGLRPARRQLAGRPVGRGGAESLFDQSLNENWFGLSWAHPRRRAERPRPHDLRGLPGTAHAQGDLRARRRCRPPREGRGCWSRTSTSRTTALLWKAGISTQREDWDLGLTVTTPSVRLFGSGTASYTRSAVGADLGGGPAVAVVRAARGRPRVPLRVALGGGGGRRLPEGREPPPRDGRVVRLACPGFDVLDTSPSPRTPRPPASSSALRQEARQRRQLRRRATSAR